MKKHLLILSQTLMLIAAPTFAYDISAPNQQGKDIYYNIIAESEVEVTYQSKFHSTDSYVNELEVPASITHEGHTYTVTTLGERAFFSCRALKNIKLPETIKNVGMWAFAWCDAISELRLPASVEIIGANAFDGCYSLTAISASGNNFSDDGGVLFDASKSTLIAYAPAAEGEYIVPEGITSIAQGGFAACPFLTSVSLPEGLKEIGADAFYFCNNLKSIEIPTTVTSIEEGALTDCFNLTSIKVNDENTVYASVEGVLTDKAQQTILQSPGGSQGLAVMPEGITSIADMAYYRNYSLTTLKGATSLKRIGDGAMIDCRGLTTIELPEGISQIGTLAFALCDSLRSIIVDSKDPKSIVMGDDVFEGVDKSVCTLYVPESAMQAYAAADQWKDFMNILASDHLLQQTIEWDIDETLTSESIEIRLDAKASSGLPIVYRVSPQSEGLVEIDGDKARITVPGEIIITAYQPGDESYRPAEPITRTFFGTESGIIDTETDSSSIKVYGTIGAVIIKGASDSSTARVYDIKGRLIYTGLNRYLPVPSDNIYIVHVDGKTYKVAVK